MAILSTHNLGKYFGGQDIFSGLSLSIEHGDRIAMVGRNGEGKTTLLRIMAGVEPATTGEVFKATRVQIGYLQQHSSLISTEGTLWELALGAFVGLRRQEAQLRQLEESLAVEKDHQRHHELLETYGEAQAQFELDGGYQYEQTIKMVLTGLGFTVEDYNRPLLKFSGGEQSRAHLARILLEQPQLLLLDEPTNHLDLASVEWLENFLQTWPGAVVVVAHDRYFLDKVANKVWELSRGQVELYRGNFSMYIAQRDERAERRKKEYQTQQAFIAKEEEFIRRNLAGQRTKEAQGRRKRLERLSKLDRPEAEKDVKLNYLQTTLRSGDLVLATHDLVIGYPDGETLVNLPDLEIKRGHRVALLGPNGAGKTTLLKTVLSQIPPKDGVFRLGAGVKVGYFAQTHADLNQQSTILDEILAVRNLPIGEARNYLGQFLFSGDDVFKSIAMLSGGERSRVALAKLTLTGANFLILDEPTNHLDIASQETLESVLKNFEGTILLVSHDRYFVDALATHTWAMEPAQQSVTVIKGGYSAYLAYQQDNDAVNGDSNANGSSDGELPKGRQLLEKNRAERREQERRARQVAELESAIEVTEQKLATLSTALEVASSAQDVAKLQSLGQDYQDTEEKLEELITRWTELETV
jgi:ATP-binding cassette subfamily F protein 3